MQKDPMRRYAESLEKTIQHNYSYLKEAVEDFRGLCLLVTPEKNIPHGILVDIRELYREIRDRLTEINAIQLLLQGKYRQYYRRDSSRDKDIMEFGFVTKNLYSKVDYILLQQQAMTQRMKEEISRKEQKSFPQQWFHSRDHQIVFIRNLRILNELDYEDPSDLGFHERRKVLEEKARYLTLFCLKGKVSLVDEVYPRIRLREHDIVERYAPNEVHGLITHLREISPSELEKVFQRIVGSEDLSKLKCLLITIHSPKDLGGDRFDLIKKTIDEMEEGMLKALFV